MVFRLDCPEFPLSFCQNFRLIGGFVSSESFIVAGFLIRGYPVILFRVALSEASHGMQDFRDFDE